MAAVTAAVRQHRGLRRARAQLLGDLGALLAGLRPAVMLDYVVTPAEAVAALVRCLSETAAPEGALWSDAVCLLPVTVLPGSE